MRTHALSGESKMRKYIVILKPGKYGNTYFGTGCDVQYAYSKKSARKYTHIGAAYEALKRVQEIKKFPDAIVIRVK